MEKGMLLGETHSLIKKKKNHKGRKERPSKGGWNAGFTVSPFPGKRKKGRRLRERGGERPKRETESLKLEDVSLITKKKFAILEKRK